jgi:hypothetical protein
MAETSHGRSNPESRARPPRIFIVWLAQERPWFGIRMMAPSRGETLTIPSDKNTNPANPVKMNYISSIFQNINYLIL